MNSSLLDNKLNEDNYEEYVDKIINKWKAQEIKAITQVYHVINQSKIIHKSTSFVLFREKAVKVDI